MDKDLSVKICGINDSESAKACEDADYVGFVFYQKSERFVTAFEAKEISNFLSKKPKLVGLFVDSDIELIEYITNFVKLDIIQLHGSESLSMIKTIKKKLGKPIIKAIPVKSKRDVQFSKKFEPICEMILFDTKTENFQASGGTGKSFDWKLLNDYNSKKNWMLAGGLNIKNVKKAVEETGAPTVDISSGVELKKGIKCPKKIKQLIEYVKKNKFKKI